MQMNVQFVLEQASASSISLTENQEASGKIEESIMLLLCSFNLRS